MRKALFLDRDGIINQDTGYLYQIKDCKFVEGVFELCQQATREGWQIFVITNQSGIARGLYSVQQMHQLHQWMKYEFKQRGAHITQFYFCPHHSEKGEPPYDIKCSCRKPEPGLLLEAARQHEVALPDSIMLGDKHSDMLAAKRAGIQRRILLSSQYDQNSDAATQVIQKLEQIKL
ncbi:D-glycero-beta-D-manno-heptose 1,7-bisphosphate 7-phosphatase [Gayadomonas joobiniege]|uniref:D-glycero-beta-D-manno-heptose 1,7-bisphosphate 7-phosphatase n=1 Tax=Gayadomonas joobiniege TaxID=1234606 RepID=UPI0003756E14|nr:D-glycero-beta-D-manno-heptose 1,7-bisphosphate 7-phosphatase [Gayadomonas joobiniege]